MDSAKYSKGCSKLKYQVPPNYMLELLGAYDKSRDLKQNGCTTASAALFSKENTCTERIQALNKAFRCENSLSKDSSN